MQIAVLIPARMQSTRFPGKPLAPINGLPMIVHCARNSLAAEQLTYVCTDSTEISRICDMYSVPCITTPSFETGTDRVAWSAKKLNLDHIANVQGDEPMLNTSTIKQFLDCYRSIQPDDSTILNGIASIDSEAAFDPNNVKAAVCDNSSRILYLSRKALPNTSNSRENHYFKQLGMYAMNSHALEAFSSLPQSRLELAERVEMLRWIESGNKLAAQILQTDSISVDTPADFLRVTNSLKEQER